MQEASDAYAEGSRATRLSLIFTIDATALGVFIGVVITRAVVNRWRRTNLAESKQPTR